MIDIVRKHNYGTWIKQKDWLPLHIVDAEGCFFVDAGGNKYLDFASQAACSNLGHKNKKIIGAIEKQSNKLCYVAPWFTSSAQAELSELLLEIFPEGLSKFFYSTSGTEANEAAFKIARMFTGKYKIISRYNSYHGSTAGSISTTGDFRRWGHEPVGTMNGIVFGPECNCYRCPFKLDSGNCQTVCVDYFDYIIKNENNVAAVIIEPIVGTNGVLVPPKDYLQKLRDICDRNNVLLIFDEVMSGWCRTGEWFACQHWNVFPDILTTAKGATSAYVPLGITATTQKIANFFNDVSFAHGHTYASHPLMLATSVATIEEMKRLELRECAREKGTYLGECLQKLKDKHKSVGDVRGKGLLWAVELVQDQKKKTPFNTAKDKFEGDDIFVSRITKEMFKRGVYMLSWTSHFILAPPLIISRDEIDFAMKVLDESLAIADNAT